MTTTTNLNKPTLRARFDGLPLPVAIGICVFCLIAIAALVGRIQQAPATAPAAIIIVATVPAVVPPTAAPVQQVAVVAPAGNVTRRAIVVYGAPDLATAIGAVEPGRSYRLLARFGSEWLQVEVSDGTGIVYVRTSDVLGLSSDLVDLQPSPAPLVVYQPVYVPASAPQPAYDAPAAPPQAEPPYQVDSQPPPVATPAPIYPTSAPMTVNDVNAEWARQQWAMEHP